jgi:hypothetical protein
MNLEKKVQLLERLLIKGDQVTIENSITGKKETRPAKEFKSASGKPYEYWPDTKELLENSAVAVAYNTLWRKRPLMGSDNVGFVLSNAAHEYLLKYYGTSIGEFFMPKKLIKDQDAYFQVTDLTDALRKAPFLAVYQALLNKFIYKKSFSSNLMHDLIADTAILSAANLGDRMMYGSKDSPYKYQ